VRQILDRAQDRRWPTKPLITFLTEGPTMLAVAKNAQERKIHVFLLASISKRMFEFLMTG
jgi:hypothetical protein